MSSAKPNSQYNVAAPDSIPIRLANSQRRVMFDRFLLECAVKPSDTILDVGVTSDQSYASSNYVEAWYPHKDRIVAAGIDDAQFLEDLYPGVKFVFANGLDLPFADREFDVVHSSAVLEHVGSLANQAQLVRECARAAKRAIFLTTPNRWFPVEFHTSLPLAHWLPKPVFRNVLGHTSLRFFADEANLNLMSARELQRIGLAVPGWTLRVIGIRLFGLTSNLVITGHRDAA